MIETGNKRQKTRGRSAGGAHFSPALLVFFVSLLMFSRPVPAATPGKILIEVARTAEVTNAVIYLGEVANITAPDFFKEELTRIDLGKSPRAGQMKQLSGARVTASINAMGLNDNDIHIQVPERVFIKRASQELVPSDVKKALEQFLSGFLPKEKFKLKAFRVRGLEPYPQGDLSLVFDKRYTPSSNDRLSIHAEVWVDGVKVDRLTVRGRLSQIKPVIVAATRLQRGDIITPADVTLRDMEVFGRKSDIMTSVEQVDGMVITRTIDKGECVSRGEFKQAPAIKKGAVIKLVAQKNRLSIVTLGISKEDGYPGRPVTVQNLTSGKLVRGLVTADGTVEVLF
ncbi:flagellar basal body P-ring formation chaperone FlgA [Desulfobacter latus]|uniref:Flagellar basal body P-ring formation protein FlgA n=1 Tax=Desulfobacter latus TaxID=2292 RepID=A0A850T4B2_9BACT|nr:flagellar basal body P-ring formation chaperone FlgA [Desulfobacter latus]NWH04082.1 flagellar basal body P-ring formation protein FlgA [Desulfobacter latus]